MPHPYPLSTLLEARQRAKESAELLLAQHVSACESAEKSELDLRSRLEVARLRLHTQAQEQLNLAQQGVIAALELQAADRHRCAAQLEIARIDSQLEDAVQWRAKQRSALERARQAAVLARLELAIVERHRGQHFEGLARAEELQADELAAEVWAAQHHLPNSRSR